MVLRALPLMAALLAAASMSNVSEAGKLLQIPLKRHETTHSAEHRALRLQHQQDRIRRRLNSEVAAPATMSATDANSTVGSVVFNEVPLGVGIGTHYAELYMGIPTQKASVIVDTGSHLTAFPCNTCRDCGHHTDPLFDVAKSKTLQYVTCRSYTSCTSCNEDKCYISQSYTEGSMWSAIMIEDVAWLGGMNDKHPDRFLKHFGVRMPVGCQTKETGLFITQKENGIMGFGRDKATLMSHMLAEGRIDEDTFAMCFSPTGGSLVLGGVDYSHHRTKVAYTPLVGGSSSWYPVKVKDILVGGKTLGVSEKQLNSGRGIIVDSGTTDTFFVASAARAFNAMYSDIAGTDYSEDWMKLSQDELMKLPNITIVLQGDGKEEDIELEIPATKYLSKADDGTYYGNFHFSERSGGVLGASTMVGYDVIFDMEERRIGFAESLCDATKFKHPASNVPQPSGPQKDAEPVLEKTNATSTSGSGSPSSTTPEGTNGGSSISTETSQAKTTSTSSSFFIQIVMVSLVGIVAVVGFKRLRKSSWVPLAESETTRECIDESDAQPDTMSPPRRANATSPTSPTSPTRSPPSSAGSARWAPAPRFTIGSESESDHGGSPRAITEL